ncbi:hypothetical protein K438DRAFT_1968319 [Mycena galopus ATCC 62051]|nr:hypothetical protein K438DRAFT_1968319 [Mycena galopus ATCC 62051]
MFSPSSYRFPSLESLRGANSGFLPRTEGADQQIKALTTGFCGSLTTFSGWQLDIFKSWLNVKCHGRRLQIGVRHLTLIGLLFYGMHLANEVSPYFRPAPSPGRFLRDPHSLYPPHLSPVVPAFPLGTYAANSFETALLGTFHVLQNTLNRPLSGASCTILQALGDGYCGCLTTVSTFAAEITTLKTAGHKYRYGPMTWATGQVILVCIFGAALWGGSIEKDQTCVFDRRCGYRQHPHQLDCQEMLSPNLPSSVRHRLT